MGVLRKKSKYFIGGIEGDKLEPVVAGLINDAIELNQMSELREICKEVLRVTSIQPTVPIAKEKE